MEGERSSTVMSSCGVQQWSIQTQSYSAQPQTTLQEEQRGFCDGLKLQSKSKPPSERQFERYVKPNTTYQPTHTSDTVVCRLCPSPTTALRAFSQTYISTKRYRRHPLPISVAAKRVVASAAGGPSRAERGMSRDHKRVSQQTTSYGHGSSIE